MIDETCCAGLCQVEECLCDPKFCNDEEEEGK